VFRGHRVRREVIQAARLEFEAICREIDASVIAEKQRSRQALLVQLRAEQDAVRARVQQLRLGQRSS